MPCSTSALPGPMATACLIRTLKRVFSSSGKVFIVGFIAFALSNAGTAADGPAVSSWTDRGKTDQVPRPADCRGFESSAFRRNAVGAAPNRSLKDRDIGDGSDEPTTPVLAPMDGAQFCIGPEP